MGSARASMSTPGTYLLTGSSTWSRPASRSCRTTAAMSGLTSEPSANRVSGVTGSAAATSASPWTATCSRASVVSRATARPGAPVCACEARKRSNRSRCGPALTVPEYGDALQPPQRRNGQAPWSDRRAAPGAAATGDLATPPLRALEGARFLEWLPSLRPAAHFNCQLHCMSRVLAAHGRDDALRCLVQPIGFSFEVDLVSRDWLLGGHSEATFHAPVYQRGVSAVGGRGRRSVPRRDRGRARRRTVGGVPDRVVAGLPRRRARIRPGPRRRGARPARRRAVR